MNKLTEICLIENNLAYRKMIHRAFDRVDSFHVSSEFSTAEIALREIFSAEVKPDLILLDICLPGMSGVDALPLLRKLLPDVKVMMLSQSGESRDILRSIGQGASGYLLKTSEIHRICEAVTDVMAGGASLTPVVAKYLVDLISQSKEGSGESPLTARELRVLELIAEGAVKKEIAEKLSISYSTVDTHTSNIYEKLRVNNGPSAVSIAYRLGLLK